MFGHRSAVARAAIGFGIVACIGCRSANMPQPNAAERAPSGTGQQMGPLFFDPAGADFTVWVNHFKSEVYRNWIIPQQVLMGSQGHVDIEFTVERDGSITNLSLLKSAGQPALDEATKNALLGGRQLPLPSEFGPPKITMQVTFFYNERPRRSN